MPQIIESQSRMYDVRPAARVTYHHACTVSIANSPLTVFATGCPPDCPSQSTPRTATNMVATNAIRPAVFIVFSITTLDLVLGNALIVAIQVFLRVLRRQ